MTCTRSSPGCPPSPAASSSSADSRADSAGYFRVVAYDGQVTPGLDDVLAGTLRADPDYRLAASIPVSGGVVTYYVWVHQPAKPPAGPGGSAPGK